MAASMAVPEAYFDPDDPEWDEEEFYGYDPEVEEYYEEDDWEDDEEGGKTMPMQVLRHSN